MTDGIININKPAEWTSQDVCAKLRRRLHIKKIGHTGTLDPMATGVLPVCIGRATRIIEYFDNDFKTYHAGMRLGYTSDTLDIWGNTEKTEGFAGITEEAVRAAIAAYTGRISQIPPKYSALRINGRRAYDLARSGEEFEIRAREITIASNAVTSCDLMTGEIEFDVTCSKGTYIRTICDDIGRTLGCGAVMSSLVRTKSGYFDIADACDINDLIALSDEEIEDRLIPMDRTLTELGIIELDDNRFTAFINGNSSGRGFAVTAESHFMDNAGCPVYRVYNRGVFLGTAAIIGRDLIPAKVINR